MAVYVCNFNEIKSLNVPKIDIVNTTSRSSDFGKGLSPFFIGPCVLYDDKIAENVENGWQFSKVYKDHMDGDNITDEYWQWANRGWRDTFAHRYPMGKGSIPEFSIWDGVRLGYVEARKNIYIPLYRDAVTNTNAFRILKRKYTQYSDLNKDMYLLDFDAYMHKHMDMSYNDVVHNEKRKMGHAFILAMLLECPEYVNTF